jgi:hypothetical protein
MAGSETDVESTLRAFQDAIAYVSIHYILEERRTNLDLLTLQDQQVPIHGSEPDTEARQSGGKDT